MRSAPNIFLADITGSVTSAAASVTSRAHAGRCSSGVAAAESELFKFSREGEEERFAAAEIPRGS